jgi:hypothetical protein
MVTTSERNGGLIDERSAAWVDAGLISEEQRVAIHEFEASRAVSEPRRLTVVAEVASYLGSVIAFAGGAAIVAPNWSELGLPGQLTLAVAVAVVGFASGTFLVRLAEPGAARLGGFLWVVAAGGVALAVGLIVDELDHRETANVALAVGLSVAAVGFGLWRNLDRPLQLLTGAVGVAVAWSAVAELTDMPVWTLALSAWVGSVAFGVAGAAGVVRPRETALIAAAAGAMLGSFAFGETDERLASVMAVATAAVVVAYGLIDRTLALVGVGLFAFLMATTMLMAEVLEGTVARLVAVIVGLLVVTAVAVEAQRRPGPSR